MSRADRCAMTVAGCRLGSVRFAVAVDDVLQLLPPPSALIALPRHEGAMLGAFVLRGVVVPIVDLRRWLPWPGDAPDTSGAPAQLMVLRQGARWLAVGIDGVDGLHRVGAEAGQRLDHGHSEDEVFGSVVCLARPATQPAGEDVALGLLDVAALMRLGKVWAQALEGDARFAPEAAPGPGEQDAAANARTACALLECEGQWLAIPTAHLRSVLPMPALQPLWQGDPGRLGVARWRGRDVPVLRLPSMPGIGGPAAAAATAPLLAVLEHEGLCMGIPVQAVRDVQMLDLAAAQAIGALGVAPNPVLAGLLSTADGGRALLIDVQALVSGDPLTALSTAPDSRDATRKTGVQAHIVVRAGTLWALPISAFLEVIELPAAWHSPPAAATPWCHTWRQRTVPLWDLRALMGHGATPAGVDAKVLILQSGTLTIGFVVEALLHLLPARTSELLQLRRPDGRMLPFVVHHDGVEQRSFAVLGAEDWPQSLAH